MGIKDEINEMFDALEGKISDNITDPPVEDELVDEDGDEDVKTEAPTTDESVDESVDEAKTEPPSTEAPVDDLARIKEENENLRKRIDEMSKPKTEPPKTDAPSTDPPVELQDFVKDLDLDEVSRDPEEFNSVLNKVFVKAVKFLRGEQKKETTNILTQIPSMVKTNVTVQKELEELSNNFYDNNEDLKPFKKIVGVVFDELLPNNADKTYGEILNLVGTEVRTRLELDKAPRKKKADDSPPRLPHKSGNRRVEKPKPKTNSLADEIAAMNEVVHR